MNRHNYLGVSQRESKFKNCPSFCLRLVTNHRVGLKTHASLCFPAHAHIRTSVHGKMVDLSQASSLEGSTNTMISSTFKPHTNAHTVCGRPTLNVFERFLKGSLRGLYERSIYERTFLSEPIENHAKGISNEVSTLC